MKDEQGIIMPQTRKFLKASTSPEEDIALIAPFGQPKKMRVYKKGYEEYFNQMPILREDDKFLREKVELSSGIMKELAGELIHDPWTKDSIPQPGEFERRILALESPQTSCIDGVPQSKYVTKEGPEFVVALWGTGFTSPIHGHAPGYLHEEVLHGCIRVNTYRMTHPESNVVRPVRTDIVGRGTLISQYAPTPTNPAFRRQSLIHNFTAVTPVASLHYLAEHTRDGADNGFRVEYFDEFYDISSQVKRISSQDGMYLKNGDVVLVRSTNVPEYEDHYIVITGRPIMKDHGLRVQEIAIPAPKNCLLDDYVTADVDDPINGLILLKLNEDAQRDFHWFHNIKMDKGEVVFPEA